MRFFVLFCAINIFPVSLFTLEPLWIRAMSGSLTAPPAVHDGRVYALTEDRSVTCLTSKGDFLWSKPIQGRIARFISAEENGLIHVLSSDGILTTLSRDGLFLWNIRFENTPVCPPFRGRDGRSFFLFNSRLICITEIGSVLWNLNLGSQECKSISETGEGQLLIYTHEGIVFLVSPFGELLTQTKLYGALTHIEPLPAGFAASFSNGSVNYYDVRPMKNGYQIEKMWSIDRSAQTAGLAGHGGTVYIIYRDGILWACNATDGSVLWSSTLGFPISGSAQVDYTYSHITVLCEGRALSFDENGNSLWTHQLSSSQGFPIMDVDGMIYSAGTGWNLAAFQPETRILTKKSSKKTKNYSILTITFPEFSYMNASDHLFVFFERVDQEIKNGTVGVQEPLYALWLTEIISGTITNPFSDVRPDSTARGRAASLLGRLGSQEYRSVLLHAARDPFDESVAIGIIHGLSRLGPDTDGETVTAVINLAQKAGIRRPAVQFAACDSLYALSRYSSGSIRDSAVRSLAMLAAPPYWNHVQNYAQKALTALLQ